MKSSCGSLVEDKTKNVKVGNLIESLKCQDKTRMAIEEEIHWSFFKERIGTIKAFFLHKELYHNTEQMGGLRLKMKKLVRRPS